MEILVTGASGFIGNRLLELLATKNVKVRALFRDPAKAIIPVSNNIQIVLGDIRDGFAMEKAVAGCDAIFHLGAIVKLSTENPNELFETNVNATRSLIEMAIAAGVKKFVFTSSAGVFKLLNGKPGDEQNPYESGHISDYLISKMMAEKMLRGYLDKGMDLVTVFPSTVFGPGIFSDSNYMNTVIKKLLNGKTAFLPDTREKNRNYCFVDDLVNGYWGALEHGRSGERYILGGGNYKTSELLDKIREQTGNKGRIIWLPQIAFQALYPALKLGFKLKGKALPFSRKDIPNFFNNRHHTCNKAIMELGYSITPLDEAVEKTVNYVIQES